MGALARASTRTKANSDAHPTVKVPQTDGLLQPSAADSMNPQVMPAKPIVTTSAPAQSSPVCAFILLSGTHHVERRITAAATGTLMKNTHRQEACATSQPPSTGPKAGVIEVKPDQVTMARPRTVSL